MYLKKLELQGFKSFADKTTFEFKPGITSVIGPNGSGKSNISDAIRWVLGEQSMKQLRGSKAEDIIFSGTVSRKSLGFAEVSISFDNTDNALPIEYSEVVITRRIYRTGESGYFINKNACRLKDILELFMDTGIGKDGYSIIGQGRIDEILSTKSEDRRRIFEEAAGIVKYRVRKEESEKKLEQTKLNLVRINDILSEIESNLEPLKNQSEKAKEYLRLRDELKDIEIGLFIYKIEDAKQKLEKNQENKTIFENQNQDEERKLDELQETKTAIREKIDNITQEIERLQNLGTDSKTQIEKINSNINVTRERITNNNQNKNRLENEIRDSKDNIITLEEDKKNRKAKGEDLTHNKEKFEKELQEKLDELKKITDSLSKEELENETNKRMIETLTDEKYELQNKITANETNHENLLDRKKSEEKNMNSIISELDKNRIIQNEMNQTYSGIEGERKKNKSALDALKNKQEEINKKSEEYTNKIHDLEDLRREKQTKYNFLVETEKEKEGYVKAVKSILEESERNTTFKKGLCGVLGNIISTDDKYQTAIEMALGASIQNIVTEKESDAKNMIEYLRKNNIGRATFLPIASIHGKKLEKEIKSIDGVFGIASDLVKADKKYEQIVLNLLGRTVVVDNLETAIKLAQINSYNFKIVTLDGDIINPQGSISGGSVKKEVANILGRKFEIDNLAKDIKSIDSKIEKIKAEQEEYINSNKDIEVEIESMNKVISDFEIEHAKEEEKYRANKEKLESLEKARDKSKSDISKIEEDIKNLETEKQEFEKNIEIKENRIAELSSLVEEFSKKNKEDQEYIDNLNNDITNLKISVSSFDESNVSIKEMLERIDSDIASEKESIKNKEEQIKLLGENNEELTHLISELKESIVKIEKDVEGSTQKQEELKKQRVEQNSLLDGLEKDIESQFETIQKLKSEIIKLENKEENIKQDIEDVINDLWNNYEITPNNAKDYIEVTNVRETQSAVNKLHDKIKDLGDVNVNSIEEYTKTLERYDTMNEQRLDLETTMSKLRNVIQEMTETMKKQFMSKFALINKYFNEVFVELFDGGRAEIKLEDEDNVLETGIDIQAQPTGKKLQNMMLLSGGEKALTAIALLFAILKINPAPFCILDEIDAALDDVNVYRFAEFLKKFTKKTQFLVITHRKGTMDVANTVYGITMEENGISKLLSINLK